MRRRDLLALVAGPAAIWPLAAAAQQTTVPVVGVLVGGTPDPRPFLAGLRSGLTKLGYAEGRNILLDIRSAAGKAERLPDLAADLVRANVRVIVAYQTPTILAAKRATGDIPIVMAGAGAPVETGLIASLARPGGNITGTSATTAELAQKNLQILGEIRPALHRVGVLVNEADPLFAKAFLEQNRAGAARLGIAAVVLPVKGPADLPAGFAAAARERVEAIVVQPSLGTEAPAGLALANRLPAASPRPQFPAAGGLMSYSAKVMAVYRETAAYVDKILKGAKPGDLPVEEPTTFELIINLKTATALDLTVPPSLLAEAGEVIE